MYLTQDVNNRGNWGSEDIVWKLYISLIFFGNTSNAGKDAEQLEVEEEQKKEPENEIYKGLIKWIQGEGKKISGKQMRCLRQIDKKRRSELYFAIKNSLMILTRIASIGRGVKLEFCWLGSELELVSRELICCSFLLSFLLETMQTF